MTTPTPATQSDIPSPGRQKSQKKRLLFSLSIVVVVLLGLGTGGAILWSQFGEKISQSFGWSTNDYSGEGTGEVIVTIRSGEIGSDVAATLAAADVVKTSQAFYDLLLQQETSVDFYPGSYQLREHMSAQAALDALLDPQNKLALSVTVPEGISAANAMQRASDVLGIPIEEFERAAANPAVFGVPESFPSLEGFLFPATYTFEPIDTAESVIQTMVDRMWQALEQNQVPVEQTFEILTIASIIQREAGSNLDDFAKISRVFNNRLDIGMRLQSDATVAYGTGRTDTVWTTQEERNDASNLYNTYANDGLPIGPIGLPGDVAIEAAMKPAAGAWLFFVPINLETGETVFTETVEQHNAAVNQLSDWCVAHRAEGGTRCD